MQEGMLMQQQKKGGGNWPLPPLSEFRRYYDTPGDGFAGWYGILPSSEFMTNIEFQALCGTNYFWNTGAVSTPWFKFYLDGKILFSHLFPICSGMTWGDLDRQGLARGGDDGKVIVYKGNRYLVRLWRAAVEDSVRMNDLSERPSPPFETGSEWHRLMLNLTQATTLRGDRGVGDTPWANYTARDMLGPDSNGYTWFLNELTVPDGRVGRIQIPALNNTSDMSYVFMEAPDLPQYAAGRWWRPVLELLP